MSQDYECNPQNVRLKTFVTRKRSGLILTCKKMHLLRNASNALTNLRLLYVQDLIPVLEVLQNPHLRARHWGALSQVMTDLAVGKDGKPQLTFGQVGCENVKMNMRVVKHRGYSMTDSVFVERQLCGIWVRLCRNCWKPPDERPKSTTCKFLWKISKKPGVTWQMVYRVYSLDRCLPFCMNWRWGKHGKSLQFWNCRNCFGLCLQCNS